MERYRILIVDDEADLRTLLTVALRSEFEVVTAADGQEALDKLALYEPDIALIDVDLPRMNGFDLCKAIRGHATYSAMHIMIVSGYGTKSNVRKGYEAGANLFMVKPVEPERLSKNLQVTIERDHLPLRAKRYSIEALRQMDAHGRDLRKETGGGGARPAKEESSPKIKIFKKTSPEERSAPRAEGASDTQSRRRFAIARDTPSAEQPQPKPGMLPPLASPPGKSPRDSQVRPRFNIARDSPQAERPTPNPASLPPLAPPPPGRSSRDTHGRPRFPIARESGGPHKPAAGLRPPPLGRPAARSSEPEPPRKPGSAAPGRPISGSPPQRPPSAPRFAISRDDEDEDTERPQRQNPSRAFPIRRETAEHSDHDDSEALNPPQSSFRARQSQPRAAPEPEPEPPHADIQEDEEVARPGEAIVLPPKEQSLTDFLTSLTPTGKDAGPARGSSKPAEPRRRLQPLNLREIIGNIDVLRTEQASRESAGEGDAPAAPAVPPAPAWPQSGPDEAPETDPARPEAENDAIP